MEISKQALVTKAVTGDRDALGSLVKLCEPALRIRLRGKIGNRWQSVLSEDDIIQMTFEEVILDVDRFTWTGPESFDRWLAQIAQNNLRDAIRGLGRAKRPDPARRKIFNDPEQSSEFLIHEILGISTTTPSRVAARKEAHNFIHRAMSKLPQHYSIVIREIDLRQRDIEIVAQELGRSVGAVHMLRARAKDRLRPLLGSASCFFTDAE